MCCNAYCNAYCTSPCCWHPITRFQPCLRSPHVSILFLICLRAPLPLLLPTPQEMNPFTLDAAGKPFPLDMRGELDDTASFRRWGGCGLEGEDCCLEHHMDGACCCSSCGWHKCRGQRRQSKLLLPTLHAALPCPAPPTLLQRQEVGRCRVPAALWPHHDAAGAVLCGVVWLVYAALTPPATMRRRGARVV